jgi:hypothetical protein
VSIPVGLLLGQLLGNMERFDMLWRINAYILCSSIMMLIYIGVLKYIYPSKEEYFPFLVGMVGGLVVVYVEVMFI